MAQIPGTSGNDSLNDTSGNDTIDAQGGDDKVTVTAGQDTINGGSGSDRLVIDYSVVTSGVSTNAPPSENATLGGFNGTYSDNVSRTASYTSIEHFTITTGSGADSIITASGDDIVSTGSGNDLVNVGSGINQADGGEGEDGISADFSLLESGVAIDLRNLTSSGAFGMVSGFEYFGTVTGTAHADSFIGTAAVKGETINLGGGDDSATLFNGQDVVNGGAGSDRLILDYSATTSAITTNAPPAPNGTLGGFNGTYSDNVVRTATYTSIEHFTISSGSGNDVIATATGNDVVFAGLGNDSVDVGSGYDQADGGGGEDGLSANFSAQENGVAIDLRNVSSSGAFGSFSNFEYFGTVTGTAFGDTFIGTAANRGETIHLGAGDDSATVFNGNDTVNGGFGTDRLVIDYSGATSTVNTNANPSINSSLGGFNGTYSDNVTRTITYTSIEHFTITTGSGNDIVNTGSGNDIVSLGAGNDFANFGSGADSGDGGAGEDGFSADLSAATEALSVNLTTGESLAFSNFEYLGVLTTGSGNDTVVTRNVQRNETINLGAGDDSVTLFNGSDTVNGGAGFDRLVLDYSAATSAVTTAAAPTSNNSLGGFNGTYSDNIIRSVTYTSIEHFTITTGSGADNITTGTGNDVVSLGGGNDFVNFGSGNDSGDGGAGEDGFSADLSAATQGLSVNLTTGESLAFSNFEYVGTLTTGSGNDTVVTRDVARNETINLGGGDDSATVINGSDTVNGGAGSDRLVVDYSAATSGVSTSAPPSANLSLGGQNGAYSDNIIRSVSYTSIEDLTVLTGSGNDNITTGSGEDVIRTGSGNDTATAGAGNDTLRGEAGDDTLKGQDNDDDLDGGDGTDTVNGDGGDDRITMAGAGAGLDYVDGGTGTDTLVVDWSHLSTSVQDYTQDGYSDGFHSSGGGVTIVYRNIERLVVTTGSANDRFTTGTTDDTVTLGAGDDFVDLVTGADTADGGIGIDGISVDHSAAAGAVQWNLRTNSYSGPNGANAFTNFEYFGTLSTGSGNDVIVTSTEERSETINLGAGDDTATVGYGNDIVNGGSGFDTLIVDYSTVSGNISNFTGPTAGPDGFSGIFHEPSTRRTDYTGIERFIVTTGSGTDNITGASGDDEIRTGGGNDILSGAGGNDTLDGGTGADAMAGGLGDDTYTVDEGGDSVSEAAGEGTDTVRTALGSRTDYSQLYVLPAFVENLTGTSAGDQGVSDNALNNAISMGIGNDLVVADKGGDDVVDGGGGNDFLYFGAAFTNGDRALGGEGYDTLGLLGSATIAFDGDDLSSIEQISAYSSGGSNPSNSYTLTMHDANVAAGKTMLVNAASLQHPESLTFNGEAELDGRFSVFGGAGKDFIDGGQKGDHLQGRAGDDVLQGLGGNDTLIGGMGSDYLDGGDGRDTLVYASAAESSGLQFDQLAFFDYRVDKINLHSNVTAWTGDVIGGVLNMSTFEEDLIAAMEGVLSAHSAVLFRPDEGDFAGRVFAVIDANGDGLYSDGDDYVFEIINPVDPLEPTTDFFV